MKRLILSFTLIAMSFAPLRLTAQEWTPPAVEIAANHSAFAPSHITLRRGEVVTLRFSAEERGRVVQRDLRINVGVTPEHTSEVTITPSKTGQYKAIWAGRDDVNVTIDIVD